MFPLLVAASYQALASPTRIDVTEGKLPPLYCYHQVFRNQSFVVCRVNPKEVNLELHLNTPQGKPFRHFRYLRSYLKKQGKQVLFLMNAGMYHSDYSPVGLYIENGVQKYPLNIDAGYGNFFIKPNGVFYVDDNKASIVTTNTYQRLHVKPRFATQSGPMLVVKNKINKRFIANSRYKKYRNGVGINKKGIIYFVISEQKVNFESFASLFKQVLHTPNALYLDGTISSIYAPQVQRSDWFYALGPIITITK